MTRAGGWRRIATTLLGLACLGIILAAALPRIRATGRELAAARVADSRVRQLPGLVLIDAAPLAEGEFLLQARRVIPAHAVYHLAVGPGPGCGSDPLSFYWIAYELLPRAAVCTSDARWWVLYGPTTQSPPTGSKVIRNPYREMRVLQLPLAAK